MAEEKKANSVAFSIILFLFLYVKMYDIYGMSMILRKSTVNRVSEMVLNICVFSS